MILHTLNASPASDAFAECLRLLAPGDAVLLLGDGVYCSLVGTSARAQLDAAGAELHALHDDVAAAGILGQVAGASTVDIDGFVALTERFSRQLAWY